MLLALPLTLTAQEVYNKQADSLEASTIINVLYGKQSRQSLTSSVFSVSGSELRKTQTSTLSNSMFGRFPGMAAIQTDGEPGYDEATIYMHGQHSMRGNGFVILVDGFETDAFNQLSADEIESVTLLKDAAALAMYGIKSANGVLLVTTKRGVVSRTPKIAFNARYGLQTPTYLPKLGDSYTYASLYNEALQNDGLSPVYTPSQLDGFKSESDRYLYPNTNWYDEVLKKISSIQDYTLTFSGGNNFARYFVMGGFMSSAGLYANTDKDNSSNINFQRFNFRANVDIDITKSLLVQVGLGGRVENRKFPANITTADLFRNMVVYAPTLYTARTHDGQLTGTSLYPNNPVGSVLGKGWDSRISRDAQATVYAKQKLDIVSKGLGVFGGFSSRSSYQGAYYKTRTYAYAEPIYTTLPTGEESLYYLQRGANTDLVVGNSGDSESDRLAFQFGAEYERSFGNHDVNALAMYQQDEYSVLPNQAAYAKRNFMGRLRYAFSQKYLAEFSWSYSGTENYPPGKKFGFFPSISAGWIISNENFLKNSHVINYLKLRASAGILGSDVGAARFAYNEYWGTSSNQGYYLGTAVAYSDAFVQVQIANPDLTWEKSKIFNIGMESKWLSNKLGFAADFFIERRSDILINDNNVTPSLSGITISKMVNKGKVSNYGIDLSASYNDRIGKLNYFINPMFSFCRNKITESYETPKEEQARYQQGRPLGQRFGLEAIGFFKDETDIANSPYQTFMPVCPGDLKYKDQNEDGIIDVHDEVAIGKPTNPEIYYSCNFGVSYKGFDVEFLLQGNSGRSVYLSDYTIWPFYSNGNNISEWAANGHWTSGNSANATFPRLTTINNTNNYRSSDFWVRNVSMLRLRNAELGYTFSGSKLQKVKVEKLRVYLSAVNLFTTSTLAPNVDPETLSVGYPTLRTYSFGLSANF